MADAEQIFEIGPTDDARRGAILALLQGHAESAPDSLRVVLDAHIAQLKPEVQQ